MDPHELFFDGADGQASQFFKGDGGHIAFLEATVRFFFHPFPEVAGTVAEAPVLCKLCITGRDETVTILHIMGVIDRVAPAFFKEGKDDFAVLDDTSALFDGVFHDLRLKGIMAPQGRVAPADDQVRDAELFRNGFHPVGDILVHLGRFVLCECPGVRQDEEDLILFLESARDRFLRPIRIDGNPVDGLDACRVII